MVKLQIENQQDNMEFNISLSGNYQITLEIFGITGRKIKKLVTSIPLKAGQYKYQWNGFDQFGLPTNQRQFFAKLFYDDNSVVKYFEFNSLNEK
jgi:hypothetical protein